MKSIVQYSSLILILYIAGISCRSEQGQVLDSIQEQIDNVSYNQNGIQTLQKAIFSLDSLKSKCKTEEPKLISEINNLTEFARKKISTINKRIFIISVDLHDLDYTYSVDKLEQKLRQLHNFIRTHQLDLVTKAYIDSIQQEVSDRVEMYRQIARKREQEKQTLLSKIRNGKADFDDFSEALKLGLEVSFQDVGKSYPSNLKSDVDTSRDGYLVISYYGMRGGRYVVWLFKFKGFGELIDVDEIYGDNRFRSRLL